MAPESYTPKQAADVLDVHANTVRAWASAYAAYLSDGANARPRSFAASDVAVLQAVKQWRDEDVPPDAIVQRLREIPRSELQTPYVDVTDEATIVGHEATEAPEDATAPLVAASQLTTLYLQMAQDVSATQQRLERLERSQVAVYLVAAGVVAAVLLILLGVLVGLTLARL